MPINHPWQTLAVSEAAEAVGVTIHSLRRWCEWHAAHLSPGANPPAGQARRLTGVDIEALRHVKMLRGEGLQTVAINERLTGLTFAEIDNGIAEDSEPNAMADNLDAIQTIQAGSDSAPAMLMALDAIATMQRRFEAMEVTVKEVKQTEHKLLRDGVLMFMAGAIVSLLLVLIVLVALSMYAGR